MKKIYLSIIALLLFLNTDAQYSLSGTSYRQDFNNLQMGMPEGWEADTNAKAGTSGGAAMLTASPSTATRWNNAGGGFKNVASANGYSTYSSASAALQLSDTDRALAVRQTGTFGDPGAAFTFRIDNTYGLSDFELNFNLQTLDSNAGRSSEWLIQYAVGDTPVVFTTLAAYKTGGFKFENTPVTANFGSLLDNQAERVWIRIATLAASTGSGSRTTTAIDDVVLSWKGVAVPGYRPLVQRLFPANGTVGVKTGSILSVRFSRYISLGSTGSIRIKNETDNTLQTIHAGSTFLTVSGKTLLISGVLLDPGKTYHVTFDSSLVDTAGAGNYAWEDTSLWRFSAAPLVSVQDMVSQNPRFLVVDKGNGRVTLLLGNMAPGSYGVDLLHASGRHIFTKNVTIAGPSQEFDLDELGLSPGLYVVRVFGKQVQLVQKFMICK